MFKHGGKPKLFWALESAFDAAQPAYPKHLHRNKISGCATVTYYVNETGQIENLTITNQYPKGFLGAVLEEYYLELRLKPSKHNEQGVPVKQFNIWRFDPLYSVNRDKFRRYCG